WDGSTLMYLPEFNFHELETVNVSARVCDRTALCPPNCGNIDWSFVVLDDDTLPPTLIRYSPLTMYYELPERIKITLYDRSGIYIDPLNPFMEIRSPGGRVFDTLRLIVISDFGDSAMFETEETVAFGDSIRYVDFRVIAYDNDFDDFRNSDRTVLVSDWKRVNLVYFYLTPGILDIDLGELCLKDTVKLNIMFKNSSQNVVSIDSVGINPSQMVDVKLTPHIPLRLSQYDSVIVMLEFYIEQFGEIVSYINLFSALFSYPIARMSFVGEAKNCLPSEFSVAPNPFSPNGDLVNDEVIFEFPWYDKTEIIIFNIRGDAIFRIYTGNGRARWDGKDARGVVQDAGIYPYVIKVNGELKAKGSVVIAR
ncbi:MAG: gliding motility-associated C-terminal domain-containing protein, partial [bacterium]